MIAIDACVLSSALRVNDPPMVNQRARALLKFLDERKVKIVIPAPAAFEFLSFESVALQDAARRKLIQRFEILPFDLAAIPIAARISKAACHQQIVNLYGANHLPKDAQAVSHQRIRVDTMILAVAEANGCEAIYTRDIQGFNGLKSAGNLKVEVRDVPPLPPSQQNLFDQISCT